MRDPLKHPQVSKEDIEVYAKDLYVTYGSHAALNFLEQVAIEFSSMDAEACCDWACNQLISLESEWGETPTQSVGYLD